VQRLWLIALAVSGCNGFFGVTSTRAKSAAAEGLPQLDDSGRYICDTRYPAKTEMRPLANAQYRNAIRDIFDARVPASDRFPKSSAKPTSGYSTEAALNVLSDQGVEYAVMAAEDVAVSVVDHLNELLPCARSQPNRACAETFIDTYARRAYRRSLSSDEKNDLLATFDGAAADGGSFSDGIAFIVDHMLQTAHFLWVAEGAAGTSRALDGNELASRLSFMFWDSIPDDALLSAAATLSDPTVLVTQAERLLASDKANTAIARFFREWTQTEQVSPGMKDRSAFPDFDDAYAASMNESFDRFVLAEVREQGTLQTLLRSNTAWVDAAMAAHFGVSAPASGWVKVSLDAAKYSGVLTQPALLASLAHTRDTSYVFRGRSVRKRILCDELGSPPGNAMAEFANITLPADPTARDISSSVNAKSACTTCHALMDPAGLALEHFDSIGRWRERYESGKAIETAGALPSVGGETLQFTSHVDLIAKLSEAPRVATCLSTQIFRFTFSRFNEQADACAIQQIADELAASGGSLQQALIAITRTDAFVLRRDP
jgi:Protein of unknown function (DUF1592)/Protein of unknown function (DUF1588)/Protein of unknown function (DUF1595)/Protein of unknown function (DUF1585)/Protein of unknown function (DUF1587)